MTREKKLIQWAILAIAAFQLSSTLLNPALSRIQEAFPQYETAAIQTVMMLSGLLSPISSLTIFMLMSRYPRKVPILIGVGVVVLCGVGGLIFNDRLWQLALFNCLVGTSIGLFNPAATNLMYDCFNEGERRRISGLQTSFINFGGLMMSLIGGVAATIRWYAGFAFYIIAGVPVFLMSLFMIPNVRFDQAGDQAGGGAKGEEKFDLDILFYIFVIFLFMMFYNVFSSNISLFVRDYGLGTTATAGFASSLAMLSGVLFGMLFYRISRVLDDYILAGGFLIICVSFFVLAIHPSVVLMYLGSFIYGASMCLLMPQCVFRISSKVNAKSSSIASALALSVAPSLGGFVSPGVFTNITIALRGEDVRFRFLFVSGCALAMFVLFALVIAGRLSRERKNAKNTGG